MHPTLTTAVLLLALVLAACGPDPSSAVDAGSLDPDAGSSPPDSGDPLQDGGAPDAPADSTRTVPSNTDPCSEPQWWPLSLRSSRYPAVVHFRARAEEPQAREVLAAVEDGWTFHVERVGMRPVPDDQGTCGPDGAFDVFVWNGGDDWSVGAIADNPGTWWNDRFASMIVDPSNEYGGALLHANVVHEMAHASQAADDWDECPILFEMSALFLDMVYADAWLPEIADFQARPDWSIDRDDGYRTDFMYGAALFLEYLRDRHFDGDPGFVGEMWLRSRSPSASPFVNEPDFEDALDSMLRARSGVGFLDAVTEFARWRWFTGDRVDDRHFTRLAGGIENLRAATLAVAARVPAEPARVAVSPAPQMLGTSYVEIVRGAGSPAAVTVALEPSGAASVRYVVQAVPGLAPDEDGETLDLSTGPAVVLFPASGERTLTVTALPSGADDPDDRPTDRYPFTLVLGVP